MDFITERFGLIAPTAAALSALSIPIILMYMLRLRRVEMKISSNFLWQQLVRDREANAPWQRLRFSWLLLLQLLILLALVIALTRPFAKVESIASDNVVLLLDASASMNATDVEQSRFDRARELALEVAETSGGVVGGENRVTVILVGAMPEILAASETNDFVVQQALNNAQASESGADWDTAFALAAGSFGGGAETSELDIVIITDGGSLSSIPDIAPDDQRVLVVGESAENVGISQLSISARAGDTPQLFAQLRNYGTQDTEVILSLNLDGSLFNAQRYAVPAGESIEVLQDDLPTNFTEITAELSQPSSSNVPDYLPNDDRAYAVFNASGTRRILLMTERNIFLQQVFSSLPEVELTMAAPVNGMPRDTFDLYVFDGWLPDRLPDGDIWIINPPDHTLLFRVGETIQDVNQTRVTTILEDDERTRYLDFANVNIRQFREISDYEDWGAALIQAQGGPLLIAGEVDQRQIAVLTFALQDSDLPLQLAFPILVANLTEWYTPPRLLSLNESIVPGTPVTIRTIEGDSVHITLPDGETSEIELDEEAQVVFAETQQAGIYRVEVREGDRVVGTDAFAVNLFSPQESNITPQVSFTVEQLSTDAERTLTGEEVGRRELWQYLALAGLLLLLVEWIYYHRRNLRQANVVPSLYGQRKG